MHGRYLQSSSDPEMAIDHRIDQCKFQSLPPIPPIPLGLSEVQRKKLSHSESRQTHALESDKLGTVRHPVLSRCNINMSNVNPGLMNPGSLIVMVAPNSDEWLLEWHPPN